MTPPEQVVKLVGGHRFGDTHCLFELKRVDQVISEKVADPATLQCIILEHLDDSAFLVAVAHRHQADSSNATSVSAIH